MLSRSQVTVPPASQQSIPPGKSTTPRDEQQKGSLSHRLKIAGKLFDLISGVSDVDHPLCQDCADELVMKLEKRLGELKKEKESYAAYLTQLQNEASENDGADSAAELAAVCLLMYLNVTVLELIPKIYYQKVERKRAKLAQNP